MQNLPLLPESIPRLQEAEERQGLSLPHASPVMGPEEVKSGNGSYLEREKQKSGCTLKQTICDFTEIIFEEKKSNGRNEDWGLVVVGCLCYVFPQTTVFWKCIYVFPLPLKTMAWFLIPISVGQTEFGLTAARACWSHPM